MTLKEMMSNKNNQVTFKRFPFPSIMTIVRGIIICIFMGIVWRGWIFSFHKYLDKKTSISITRNESALFRYPSITLCPGFKNNGNLREEIYWELHKRDGKKVLLDLDLKNLTDRLSYKRQDFMKHFTHPKNGDPKNTNDNDILHNDSYWISSTPHQKLAGRCFTYNPDYDSNPAKWYGMRFGLKFPADIASNMEAKRLWLTEKLDIYLHTRDNFIYYKDADMPSSVKIDISKIRWKQTNNIIVKYSTLTALNKKDQPCSENSVGAFMKCYEEVSAKRRGCQKPWFYFNDINIRKCDNISEMSSLLGMEYELNLPFFSTLLRQMISGCPRPCTESILETEYTYQDEFIDSDTTIWIWFKNFRFSHEFEYVVCDWTCLIGELGGSFGFFLGGSVILIIDFILKKIECQF